LYGATVVRESTIAGVGMVQSGRSWLSLAGLASSVLAVAVALAVPMPTMTVPPAAAANGAVPTRLRDAWPSASTVTLDAVLSGGMSFEPRLVVDATTVVGLATTADQSVTQLLVWTKDRPVRVLQTMRAPDARTVVAVVVSGGQVYWLESGPDSQGRGTTWVWRAGLFAGAGQLLNSSVSLPAFSDSQYDLELADGWLYWAGYLPQGRGEIRSVSVDGGPVRVRSFERLYGLTAWPWATSSAGGVAGDVDLVNLVTGEHRTVHASADQFLSCTPTWCRVTTPTNNNTDITVVLEHPDGSHVVGFSNHDLAPVNTDVALLDRFELLESQGNAGLATPTHRLWLHDLSRDRDVLVEDSATGTVSSRDGFLWWSTGDNEAIVWHLLDLRTLS
jgi:hypothetical protein